MTKYQLAKIIALAGRVEGRKRLQKTVYLLQVAGGDLDVDFILHLYGPYSHDLAYLVDCMVGQELLVEQATGVQFNYRLSKGAKTELEQFEATPKGKAASKKLSAQKGLLARLLKTELLTLELASTVAFFFKQSGDWRRAVEDTSAFKNVRADSPPMKNAHELAVSIVS